MPNAIHDEFAKLKISRQRKYQLRKQRDGRCVICGDTAAASSLCLKHLIARRENQRLSLGCKRRLEGAKSYRLQQKWEQVSLANLDTLSLARGRQISNTSIGRSPLLVNG
jgi:hypothetical protein